MTRPLQRGLFDEMIIDNFAGGGGASHGIELALNRPIDVAVNHDPEAVAMHKVNHPYTRHFCEDVFTVDPVKIAHGRPVGLAWFSPDCKHFSKAKGGKPVSRKVRGLAWVVVKYAQKVRPRVIMLENVEEFLTWGPLTAVCDQDGKKKVGKDGGDVLKPCGLNKGATFYKWVSTLEKLGYSVDWKVLKACDYGAPTIRKRLFLVARCDGQPIVWPAPTHGPGTGKPYRTAADCIDWSIPAPSIFERKRPLAENTLKRIAKGIRRFVLESADPFFITYYGPKKNDVDFRGFGLGDPVPTQTTENRFGVVEPFVVPIANYNGSVTAHSLQEPLRTITAWPKGGSFSVVIPHIQRQFGKSVGHRAGDPLGTITSGGGGKSALVSAFLAKHYGGNYTGAGLSPSEPISTITTKDHHAVVASHLIKLRGSCKDGQSVKQPMPTITAGGLHVGEVRSFLIKYYGTACGQSLKNPAATVTTKDRLGLITVAGQEYQIADIGMRMLAPRELYRAQGFRDDYIIDPIFNGKPLTKTAQVRMCGNSVSPYPAKALVEANVKLKAVKIAA